MAVCRRALVLLVFPAMFSLLAFSEGTRTWEQSKFDDLSKGTATGVVLPLKKPFTPRSTLFWVPVVMKSLMFLPNSATVRADLGLTRLRSWR